MSWYRCYLLDGAGAIRKIVAVAGADDREALAAAREALIRRPEYLGFELWERLRRVHVEETAVAAH